MKFPNGFFQPPKESIEQFSSTSLWKLRFLYGLLAVHRACRTFPIKSLTPNGESEALPYLPTGSGPLNTLPVVCFGKSDWFLSLPQGYFWSVTPPFTLRQGVLELDGRVDGQWKDASGLSLRPLYASSATLLMWVDVR